MSKKLKWGFGAVAVFSIGAMLHNARSLYPGSGLALDPKHFSNTTGASRVGSQSVHLSQGETEQSSGRTFTSLLHRTTLAGTWQEYQTSHHHNHSTDSGNLSDRPGPVRILLLSYQRCGSTVISSVFGDDPHTFFVFEPLDALYGAMYGTAPGWSVPTDLAINRDGSLRDLPLQEKEAIKQYMQSIYNCDFSSVPTEFLVHPFWWYFRNWTAMTKPYVSCLRVNAITDRSLPAVQHNIRSLCGQRFGDFRNRKGKCFGNLWPNYTMDNDVGDTMTAGFFKPKSGRPFRHYAAGLSQLARRTKFCVQKYLKETCQKTQLRVIKTVRGNVNMATDLLDADPHLKVIHLLRDPRGVTRSRSKSTWSRGFYDSHDKIRTAQVYCTTALTNIKTVRSTETKYKGRIMQVVLEDFLQSPEASLKEIHDFLGLPLRQSTVDEINKKMKKGFEDKWKQDFRPETIKRINRACAGLLKELHIDVDS